MKLHPDGYVNLTRYDKLLLLEYILIDEDFPGLDGIHLLPTADKNFTNFSGRCFFLSKKVSIRQYIIDFCRIFSMDFSRVIR